MAPNRAMALITAKSSRLGTRRMRVSPKRVATPMATVPITPHTSRVAALIT